MKEEEFTAISKELDLKGLVSIFSSFDQPAVILNEETSCIAWISDAMAGHLGISSEDALGKPCSRMFGPDGLPVCPSVPLPSGQGDEVDGSLAGLAGKLTAIRRTLRFICSDGEYLLVTYQKPKTTGNPAHDASSEGRYLYNKLPILIVEADSGMIVDVNSMTAKIASGYGIDLVGRNIYDLIRADKMKAKDLFSSVMKGDMHRSELVFSPKEGQSSLCDMVAMPIQWGSKPHLQVAIIGIEDVREASYEKQAEMMTRSTGGTFYNVLLGSDGRIQHASRSLAGLLGESGGALTGRSLTEFVPENWVQMAAAELRELFSTGLRSFDLPLKVGDDRKSWFEAYCTQIGTEAYMVNLTAIDSRGRSSEGRLEAALLEQLFENYPMAIMLSESDGAIINVNKACTQMFGYEKTEMIGRRADDLIVPESELAKATALTQESALGHVLSADGKRRRKDGKLIDVHFIGLPITYRDQEVAFFAIYQDISESKLFEDELTKAFAFVRSLFEVAPDGIFYKDTEGRFQMVSKTLADRRGLPPSQLVGMTYYDILPKRNADRLSALDKRVLEGVENIVIEDRLPTLTGERDFEITLSPVKDNAGKITGIIGMSHDITDRKSTERLVRDVNERLTLQVKQLERTWMQTISVLATASEARDLYTAGHQRRVAQLARAIGSRLGLSADTLKGLELAGIVHDIGKIDIPIEILTKPGKLEDVELEILRTHSEMSWRILKDIEFPWPLAEIAYQHHERIDGSGYPNRLKGDQILKEAKILAVADVVEAMSSNRPYRPSLGITAALDEIASKSDITFDKEAVEACLAVFHDEEFEFTAS